MKKAFHLLILLLMVTAIKAQQPKLMLPIGHNHAVWKACFTSDSKYVVTTSRLEQSSKIWDAISWQLVEDEKVNKNGCRIISISPDRKYKVIKDKDNTASVLDATSGQLITILKGHTDYVFTVSFSPDGKYIVTASADKTARVWNTTNWKLVTVLKGHSSPVQQASFSPDGNYLATVSGEFELLTSGPSSDTTVNIWNTMNGKLVTTLKEHKSYFRHASFSPDGKYIVTASSDSSSKVWDLSSGQLVAVLKDHTSPVRQASFSPDGKFIVTVSEDSSAKVWDAISRQLVANLKGHTNHVNDATFSPDGKYIVTASRDSTANLWNAVSGLLIANLKGHTGTVLSASFSPDGKYVVTTSLDNTGKVWNANSGFLLTTLKTLGEYVYIASFSPDGKYIITVSSDRTDFWDAKSTANVWDAISGKLMKAIKGNDGNFLDIDFKNNRIASIYNSEVGIYDLETGKKLYTFIAVDSSDYLVYDKDNHYDGTPAARKLLYFTCGREIIELDQVKDQLWVPNLAERIMKGDSINAKTLDELNICGLTPEVEDSSFKADEYYFKIFPRRGGIGETVLYLNGIEVKRYKPAELKNNGGTYELKIKKAALKDLFVAGKENRLTVKAFTSDNAISSRALNISEDKSKDKATAPNLFAVMVGVSDYKGDELDLKYPGKDATDISAVVSNAAKNLLNMDGTEHVFMYNLTTDKDHYQLPEKKSIKKVLEEIGNKATANDILLIFFAGHGVMRGSEDNKQFYFLTSDASLNSSFGAVADVGISTSELTEWIKPANIKAQKRIMIFDACNSGQAIKDFVKLGNKEQGYIAARSDENGQEIKAIEKLNNQSGLFILSASASNLAAYEMGRYSQGLLTYSLLKAIKQQPDILNEGKYLDVSKWFNAARETVSALSKETGSRQDPQIVSNTNFNIGVVDEEVMAKIVLQNEKPLFAACNFQNADENNPVDNLGLNKLIDQQLNYISARGTDAPIVYAGTTSSAEAYSLSGRYIISGNSITIKVFIIQNKEVKQKIDLTGTKDKLDEFSALIATQAAEWAGKNK